MPNTNRTPHVTSRVVSRSGARVGALPMLRNLKITPRASDAGIHTAAPSAVATGHRVMDVIAAKPSDASIDAILYLDPILTSKGPNSKGRIIGYGPDTSLDTIGLMFQRGYKLGAVLSVTGTPTLVPVDASSSSYGPNSTR